MLLPHQFSQKPPTVRLLLIHTGHSEKLTVMKKVQLFLLSSVSYRKPTEQHKYSADFHKILLVAQIESITASNHS